MTIQTVSTIASSGIFDGIDPPATPNGPIINARGIQPYDPTTTPGAPRGGFTRLGVSNYLIKQLLGMDFFEGTVQITCMPGKPNPGLCAIVAPGTETDVDVQVIGNGANDTLFYMTVNRLTYDGSQNLTPSP